MKFMPRLFTCIWIPEDIQNQIIDFQEKVMSLPIKAKAVEKKNLHLTVVFLGDTDGEKLTWIKNTMDKSLEGFKKFDVKLAGLKVIPNPSYIRVIGINVEDKEGKLSELVKKIGSVINGSYHESSKLTLCRVKSVLDKETVRKFIENNHEIEIGDVPINHVALVKSTLTRSGPVYETVHKIRLV